MPFILKITGTTDLGEWRRFLF